MIVLLVFMVIFVLRIVVWVVMECVIEILGFVLLVVNGVFMVIFV